MVCRRSPAEGSPFGDIGDAESAVGVEAECSDESDTSVARVIKDGALNEGLEFGLVGLCVHESPDGEPLLRKSGLAGFRSSTTGLCPIRVR